MDHNFEVEYFRPQHPGVAITPEGVVFCAAFTGTADCGVILYHQSGKVERIPFHEKGKLGILYGLIIKNLNYGEYCYNFYQGAEIITDEYCQRLKGYEIFGDSSDGIRKTYGYFETQAYDWEDDAAPAIPYNEMIVYGLNVRAFTMHRSSGVKYKGTFEGITEKIPYLKELGITTIELMPCYEFDECEFPVVRRQHSMEYAVSHFTEMNPPPNQPVINCWGYKSGYYLAPKTSYSYAGNPVAAFKDMVKQLHKAGIEVIMQFYFAEISHAGILEAIKFWVYHYHIDGVRLIGEDYPLPAILQEPALAGTKIWYYDFPHHKMAFSAESRFKNLAVYHDGFKNTARCFLKGDEGMVVPFLESQKKNPAENGIINYVTNSDGFTLYDMVSYERKHNESNQESNQDGTEFNYSWNCGVEGVSRRRLVVSLRLKQMKNALTMLFLSQGTPFIFSGDEIANTRYGNNNPYCQDNEVGWVKWNHSKLADELLLFTKSMIALRKSHSVFRMKKEMKLLDYLACGYPDMSYHGSEAWKPELHRNSRSVGIMLCGKYAEESGQVEDYFFIAYNMHWIPHKFSLPKLPADKVWNFLMNTTGKADEITVENGTANVVIPDRSISIFSTFTEIL